MANITPPTTPNSGKMRPLNHKTHRIVGTRDFFWLMVVGLVLCMKHNSTYCELKQQVANKEEKPAAPQPAAPQQAAPQPATSKSASLETEGTALVSKIKSYNRDQLKECHNWAVQPTSSRIQLAASNNMEDHNKVTITTEMK